MTTRHVLVLDVNVYLSVAEVCGEPFEWAKFDAVVAKHVRDASPHPKADIDCMRVIAMCQSGRFAGDDPVEIWTNAHIDGLVEQKAAQPATRDSDGFRGLGWAPESAAGLVSDLVLGATTSSNGGTLGTSHMPEGNPPLDHEDGMVYGACRALNAEDPLAEIFCVTRDRGFLGAYASGQLTPHLRVVHPGPMAALMRNARARLSMRGLRPTI